MEMKLHLLKKITQYSNSSTLFPVTFYCTENTLDKVLYSLIKLLYNIKQNPHDTILKLANEQLAIWKGA